jgi:hypothetical protein
MDILSSVLLSKRCILKSWLNACGSAGLRAEVTKCLRESDKNVCVQRDKNLCLRGISVRRRWEVGMAIPDNFRAREILKAMASGIWARIFYCYFWPYKANAATYMKYIWLITTELPFIKDNKKRILKRPENKPQSTRQRLKQEYYLKNLLGTSGPPI